MTARITALTRTPPSRPVLFAREPGWQFSLMLALEVVFLFVAVPALAAGDASRSAVTLLQFILASTAIALLAKSPWLRLGLATTFGLTLLARWLPGVLPHMITLSMAFAYTAMVTVAMAMAVFGPGDVNHHRIAGAVFVYLNIALLFALGYSALMAVQPDAFAGLPTGRGHVSQMTHLSFTLLTTMGDGDVIPQTPFARSVADLEAIIGQLFPAILLSRLVGLHVSRRR